MKIENFKLGRVESTTLELHMNQPACATDDEGNLIRIFEKTSKKLVGTALEQSIIIQSLWAIQSYRIFDWKRAVITIMMMFCDKE